MRSYTLKIVVGSKDADVNAYRTEFLNKLVANEEWYWYCKRMGCRQFLLNALPELITEAQKADKKVVELQFTFIGNNDNLNVIIHINEKKVRQYAFEKKYSCGWIGNSRFVSPEEFQIYLITRRLAKETQLVEKIRDNPLDVISFMIQQELFVRDNQVSAENIQKLSDVALRNIMLSFFQDKEAKEAKSTQTTSYEDPMHSPR